MIFAAYRPHSSLVFYATGCVLLLTPLAGYAITSIHSQRTAIRVAWCYTIVAVVSVSLISYRDTGVFRMLTICGTLLYAMKAVVAASSQAAGGPRLPFFRWIAFAYFWPGMQPSTFSVRAPKPLPFWNYFARGVLMLLLGLLLAVIARWLRLINSQPGPIQMAIATVALLAGFSLILHFGVFNIVTAFWRWAGFDCRSVFRAPFRSRSLAEFWGKRWNIAFSQMATIAVYRQIEPRFGRRRAALAAFMFSGMLHEIGVSLPVMAGFGLPTAFFLIHGVLIAFEHKLQASGHSIDRVPWIGRAWVAACLIIPLGLLFHPWFMSSVAWPLVGVGSGLSR